MMGLQMTGAMGTLIELLIVLMVGSTILISTALVVTWALRRSSASIRFSIWQTLFCGLLFVPIVTLFLPRLPIDADKFLRSSDSERIASVLINQPISGMPEEHGNESNPVFDDQPKLLPVTIEPQPMNKTARRSSVAVETPVPQQTQSGHEVKTASLSYSFCLALLSIWVLGVGAILFRLTLAGFRIRSISRSAIMLDRKEIEARAALDRDELKRIEVSLSNRLAVPVTTGALYSKILLTNDSLQLERESLRMVIRHELAHIRRRDVMWQQLFLVVASLYWFQPLIWLANKMAQREREQACDDLVLAGGANPDNYASILLDHATKASRRQTRWSSAVAISQPPLECRLKAILNGEKRRHVTTPRQHLLFALIASVLVIGIGASHPFKLVDPLVADNSANIQEEAKPFSTIQLPEKLSGKIVDEEGQPIEGVKIELWYCSTEENESTLVSRRVDHKKWNLVTDERGIYTLDTDGLDASFIRMDVPQANFIGWASADGRVGQDVFGIGKFAVEKGEIRTVQMPLGRKISGRVIADSKSATEVVPINPMVRVAGPNYWTSRPIKCDEEGHFELVVPSVGEIEVLAVADNLAATRVFAGKGEELGDIQLVSGTRVRGQILDDSGDPVSGAVVSIRNDQFNEISQLHRNGKLVPMSAVKTHMDGLFELPPHRGPCTIAVVAQARTHDADSGFANVHADEQPPIMMPVGVDLDGSEESVTVNLRQGPLVTVSGTVRWPDGRPATGIELKASLMAGGQGVDLETVRSNAAGEYQLRFPKNAEASNVGCFGARDASSAWHYADPINDLDANQKSRQILGLKKLTANLTGADWQLVAKKAQTQAVVKETARARQAENALAEISARYYRAAARDRDLGKAIVDLLELEKQYRGETAALNALRQAMQWTKHSLDLQAESIQLLERHYLSHPDLDSAMTTLTHQSQMERSMQFLKLAEASPHSQVRASSFLLQAKLLAKQLEARDYFQQQGWTVQGLEKRPEENRVTVSRLIAEARNVNPQGSRQQIADIVEKIKTEYGDLERQPFVSLINSFRQRRYKPEGMERFDELADRILFRATKLRVGQTIDDFAGKDVDGNEYKLSDFRGKVVMVMFSADWCGPCKQMYPENRALVETYKDKPFQMISVMADREARTVGAAVDSGEITWLTTWDGEEGPLASKWNISSWPTVYIIDHTGKIRSTNSTSEDREKILEQLVREAENRTPG